MADPITQVTLRIKRGTSVEWAASPYVLASGEPGYDTTLKRMKVGDGSTAWSQLKWQDVDTATLERFENAAEALEGATGANDAVMTAVAADPDSSFSGQLSSAIAQQAGPGSGVLGGLRVTKIDKYPTIYDGVKVLSRGTLFTTLISTKDYVYVGEPVTISGTQQSRVSRINKTTRVSDQDRQVRTANHDPNLGHRGVTVGVDRNGIVIVHGEIHQGTTQFFRSAAGSPFSLAGMIAVPAPAGAATSSYRRLKRDPYTGDLWLILRGDDYNPRIYKWNETTYQFDVVGANPLATGVGGYGNDLAFSRAGVMYMVPEFITVANNPAASGYPRRDIGIVQSRDGGVTWQKLDGTTIPDGGISPTSIDVLYPHPAGSDLTTYASHNSATGRVTVAADGSPVVVALWRDPAETSNAAEMSLYATKIDPYSGKITRMKLLQAPSGASAGQPFLVDNRDGYIAVIASAMFSDTSFVDTPLYLFTSQDGLRWNRHTLYDGTGGMGFGGAGVDPESLRREGFIRIQPYSILDPSMSEIWEIHLTDAPQIEAGTSTAVYDPTIPVDPPAGTLYSTDFTGTDGVGMPTGWTYRSGAPVTNAFVFASNQLGINTSSVAIHLALPPSQPTSQKHYAQVSVTAVGASTTYHPVVVVRYDGSLSGYMGRYNPANGTGAWEIFDLAGGTVLASFAEAAPTLPYTLRMEAVGSVIKLIVNGTQKVSYTATTPLTATGVGLGMRRNTSQAADNNQRVDNWEHGVPA